jgi:inner membrane protease subunit 1
MFPRSRGRVLTQMADVLRGQVPKGHMWVTGDNLPHSVDSRRYGPIPLAMVNGKILAKAERLWKWQWLRNPLLEDEQ